MHACSVDQAFEEDKFRYGSKILLERTRKHERTNWPRGKTYFPWTSTNRQEIILYSMLDILTLRPFKMDINGGHSLSKAE
jgi:hypothetical protein